MPYETEVHLQTDINQPPHIIFFVSLRISCSHSLVSFWFPITSVLVLLDSPTPFQQHFEALFLLGTMISHCIGFSQTILILFLLRLLCQPLCMFSLNVCFCSKFKGHLFFINLKFLSPAIDIRVLAFLFNFLQASQIQYVQNWAH